MKKFLLVALFFTLGSYAVFASNPSAMSSSTTTPPSGGSTITPIPIRPGDILHPGDLKTIRQPLFMWQHEGQLEVRFAVNTPITISIEHSQNGIVYHSTMDAVAGQTLYIPTTTWPTDSYSIRITTINGNYWLGVLEL